MVFTQRKVAALASTALAGALAVVSSGWAQQQQAGVAAAVRGRVELAMTAGAVGHEIKSGEPIYLGNAIKSAADSGLQILLLDQTTFTIGPNSELTIDQFVFDPNAGTGKVAASVAKGVFRFVTGKVAQANPSDMTVRLPTGNIGIRGTIAVGSVEPGANGQPPKQEVVLLGPGSGREGTARIGSLLLTGGPGTSPVTVNQPGFGSQFGAGGAWGAPVRYTNDMINAIQMRLSPPIQGKGPGAQAQGGEAGAHAGQQGAPPGGPGGPGSPGGPFGPHGPLGQLGPLAFMGAQDQQNCQQASASSCQNLNPVVDTSVTSTSFDQLRSINTGTFVYSQSGVGLSDGGNYNISVNIDFANRTIGGGGSQVSVNSPTANGSVGITAKSFSAGSGTASFTQNNFNVLGGSGCFPCDTTITLAPKNVGSTIAAVLAHSLTILANGSVTISGSGTTGTRAAGGSSVLPP